MSGVVAALALLALLLLIANEFGAAQQPQTTDSLLTLVLAAMVTGAGLTLLVWILTTAARRQNDTSIIGSESESGPITTLYDAIPDSSSQGFADTTLLRNLTQHGYWITSADGVFRQLEPAADDSQLRLRALIGKTRKVLAANHQSATTVARIETAIEARQPYRQITWHCRLAEGQILKLRESGIPRFDRQGLFLGYHGLIEDVTTETLDPHRSLLITQALEAVPVPLALLQGQIEPGMPTDWQLVWSNAPMAGLTGRNTVELRSMKAQHWMLCVPPTRADGTAGAASERNRTGPLLNFLLSKGGSHCGDGVIIDRFGRRHTVQLTIEPLEAAAAGTRLFLITADPDTAALKNLEARIAEVNQAQSEASARRLENDITARELESFSHTVSHDLRHPLRIIDGFARILQEDYSQLFDRTGNEHLNRILGASHRMSGMIDALVDLHGISSRPIAEDPVNLSELAVSIIEDLRTSQPERQVSVYIEPKLSCRGDRVLLRMALFNLIENAWKYTSRTDNASIRVDAISLHDSRVFRVTDNGAGFDKRFADRLFTLFHRLHGQTEFKGTGVGLATVQRIVRRHGGRIWADSTPDQGASFQFTLWDDLPESLSPLARVRR